MVAEPFVARRSYEASTRSPRRGFHERPSRPRTTSPQSAMSPGSLHQHHHIGVDDEHHHRDDITAVAAHPSKSCAAIRQASSADPEPPGPRHSAPAPLAGSRFSSTASNSAGVRRRPPGQTVSTAARSTSSSRPAFSRTPQSGPGGGSATEQAGQMISREVGQVAPDAPAIPVPDRSTVERHVELSRPASRAVARRYIHQKRARKLPDATAVEPRRSFIVGQPRAIGLADPSSAARVRFPARRHRRPVEVRTSPIRLPRSEVSSS